jgi:hypothetical protein
MFRKGVRRFADCGASRDLRASFEGDSLADTLMVAIMVGFVALCVVYTTWCDAIVCQEPSAPLREPRLTTPSDAQRSLCRLEPDATRPRYFVTEPGVGYRFEPEANATSRGNT